MSDNEATVEPTEAPAAAEEPAAAPAPKKVLEKPTAVPFPDEEEVQRKIDGLTAGIAKHDERIAQIRALLDRNSTRSTGNPEQDALRATLRGMREQIRAVTEERRGIFAIITERSEARKAVQARMKELGKTMKFNSVQEIDQEIEAMQYRMETSTMSLKEEKAMMVEIQNLKKGKDVVREMQGLKEKTGDVNAEDPSKSLQETLKEKTQVMTELRDKEKEVMAKLDAIRDKHQKTAPNVPELIAEQKGIYKLIKEKRDSIKKIKDDLGKGQFEWRKYQRELRAWKRQEDQKKWEQRKLERAQRDAERAEEEGEGEEAEARHPWFEEMYICDDLIKYCNSHIPKSAETSEAASTFDASAGGMVAIGKAHGKQEDNEWAGTVQGGGKKGKGKKKKQAETAKPLMHTIDVLAGFAQIGLTAPSLPSQCPDAIVELEAKKAFFDTQTDEDKKAAKAEAAAAVAAAKAAQKEKKEKKRPSDEPLIAAPTGAGNASGVDFRKAVGAHM